jgi:phenylacetate-CoA ligase
MRVTAGYWIDLLNDKFQGIEKFQVRQDLSKNFKLLLEVDEEFNRNNIELIKREVQDKFGRQTQISVQVLDSIPPSPGGKHHWVISEVSPYD